MKILRVTYSILLLLACTLIAILITGTIYALVRAPGTGPVFQLGKSDETEQAEQIFLGVNDDIRVFSGLGRLRIPLSNSSTLILSIAFPYSADDTAFMEELAGKIGEFRAAAADYFSSLTAEKLINLDEEAAKQEILKKYNAGLRLGRIHTLYFSDMMIIESAF